MKKFASLFVLAGAAFWGTTGVFTKTLTGSGISSSEVVSIRLISAAVIILIIMLISDRKALAVKLKDLPVFALTGVISVYLTSMCYIRSIEAASMSTAAILMYTAPFYVTVVSAILYREKITVTKAVALVTAFIGCVLVAGPDVKATSHGIIFGLLAGVTYASYSIFGKYLLARYSSATVTCWSFLFAAAASLFTANPFDYALKLGGSGAVITSTLLIGLITAVIPYFLYTLGLGYTDAGKASIMATLEPMMATLAGFLLFDEVPKLASITGILFIVLAILLLNNFGRIEKTAQE